LKTNEYRRSTGYKFGTEGETEPLTDKYLIEQWYIFEGPAGDKMPMEPPARGNCGTDFPTWLNGNIIVHFSVKVAM
jgi:hypothetical protein